MGNSYFSVIFHILIVLFFFLHLNCNYATKDVSKNGTSLVNIGVVLDLSSPMGSMADVCLRMALLDFYSAHSNYTTRLKLHIKNAKSLLDDNLAVLDLLKNEEVHGILELQKETENTFVAELGERVHVPIISFTATSSSFSSKDNHYFVQTTPDDTLQAQALAAICQGYEWSEVVILYEDTEYGNRFLSQMNKALQEVEIGLAYMTAIPTSITYSNLSKVLEKLKTKQTRVFLVHMNPSLGYRFFARAKEVGVMSEGYAWIISDSLSNFISSMDSVTRDSMEGVLGVRPYIHRSKELKNFQERWRRNMLLENSIHSSMELNIYGLWAYDAVTALAIATEMIGPVNSTLSLNGTDNTNLRISTFGPGLLNKLSTTRFNGLTGEFQLVDGKLKQSAIEIFNVFGSGEKTTGFWTPDRGIARSLSSNGEKNYSTSIKELKNVMWPGDSVTKPKGWSIPTSGKLRVGVPRKPGFTEFVNVAFDPVTNHTSATGYAIDIFLATLKLLPYQVDYEFYSYSDTENINWSYDDMLHKIPERFDMVVGDTTIWAPRGTYVDFSLPYSESGVVLVIKNRQPFGMWTFVRPLRWDLWLAMIVAFILMGIVLIILENRVRNAEDPTRPKQRNICWLPVVILAFPERNMVSNKWSFFVLLFWLFMAFILMQSYTANLSAMLTVDQLKFAFSDNYYIGYRNGSFMRDFLIEQLHINESRLRSYTSAHEYNHAMSLGSKNGGIDAIFDEIPYMKVFLNKYDSKYRMAGPTYRTGGFGFAFPLGSPLTEMFSKAIMNVTQGPVMVAIEQKNFGPGYSSQDPLSSTISQGTSSLTLYDFAGLFLVVGSATIFSLFCSETPIGRKLSQIITHFLDNRFHFKTSRVSHVGGDSKEDDMDGTDKSLHDYEDTVGEIQLTSQSDETLALQDLEVGSENNGERKS